MGAWELKGPVRGSWWTWRDAYPRTGDGSGTGDGAEGTGNRLGRCGDLGVRDRPKDMSEVFEKNSQEVSGP